MKVEAIAPTTLVVDILCDVCGCSTTTSFGTLEAHWGHSSVRHDGERYQVHLCEDCFFQALANLRQDHRLQNMFTEDYQPADPDTFGRVEGNQEII
ncbi:MULTISPECIES: hypothetical protein [Aeromonas]|uniref:hypothetical protein n=1 Tax=Aeromonas TaxID=642 RepID=UPI0015FA1982|nr:MULTISPECIES: hypothetical protein [Aeromonas]MBP4060979.1 hypothetical protein [Aeromonas sp. Prich7-2]GJA20712.1 hypothetical protein KAM336_37330 [Aeromonas caviae]GJA29574.1 hypothetical protein KAM340_37410 [Aeromonas caviae]GJA74279.1 hypothetical protein KAM353_39260 [Aeromonas caviae]GJB04669.1 hypothetical protein KAM360_36120 [Aeromonas caviae]